MRREIRKEMKVRLYVIGPVSGIPDNNRAAFLEAHDLLAQSGFSVLIPHDFVGANADWQTAMRRSIESMLKCDGLAVLEGSDKSHGARLEYAIATALGMPCHSVQQWASGLHKAISNEGMAERVGKRKQCPRCKRILPVALFDPSSDNVDKLQGYCRNCMVDYKLDRRINGAD